MKSRSSHKVQQEFSQLKSNRQCGQTGRLRFLYVFFDLRWLAGRAARRLFEPILGFVSEVRAEIQTAMFSSALNALDVFLFRCELRHASLLHTFTE